MDPKAMDEALANQPAKPFKEQGRYHLHLLPWLLPLLAVLYVLSIGPAYHFFSGPALPVVYQPLAQLEFHCRPFDRFMRWYMEDIWKCGIW
jgi:hypothetical protein